ncbi:MAG: glutamyl-tRNA reductase [Legionellales bacterium]|nr:glutamyl-tRNA reductase [Legionellales bacterium]
MNIIAYGFNHRTAPLALREQLAPSTQQQSTWLHDLITHQPVSEAMVLATCNRTEFYCTTAEPTAIMHWLSRYQNIALEQLQPHSYLWQDHAAIRHTMRVASGLDSMMLGEPQILGQMKQAYQLARKTGALGSQLDHLLQHVFATSKRVRSETDIGLNPISIAYAATSLAKRIFTDFQSLTVLLVGAGETIQLVCQYLQQLGIERFIIASRRPQATQALFSSTKTIEFITIEAIPTQLAHADLVVTATASPLPLIGKGMIETAIKARKHRLMLLIDLAVPRDIEPQVAHLSDVFLYNIDDLQQLIQTHLTQRSQAAQQAEQIIDQAAEHYLRWRQATTSNQLIKNYRQQMEQLTQQELTRALQQLTAGHCPQQILHEFSQRLVNKYLHQPTQRIRQAAYEGDLPIVEALRRLYE